MTPATETIFQVEREARWRVWELFGLLVAIAVVCLLPIAFLGACALWLAQRGSAGDASSASTAAPTLGSILPSAGGVLLVALMLAVLYWFLSRRSAADRLIRVMHARPLDPGDRFHHQLSDIVEEMRVATGGPAVRCLTVPTRAMNAFTFSDLHGGACIGVTEGALSGLSRRQLQGVVAHEFGHVLSGDYVTATSACLLFGVYSSIRDSLEEGIDDGRGGGPDGMSALCIRPTNLTANGFFARAVATHPPVNDRIIRLLNVAHVGWDQFLEQDAAAEAIVEQREHSTRAPEPDDVAVAARLAQLVATPIAASAAPAGVVATPMAPPAAGSSAAGQASRPSRQGGAGRCPSCGGSLERFDYEGADVVICRSCGGRLASTSQVQRILTRREMRFDEPQMALAASVVDNGDELRRQDHRRRASGQITTIACPGCGRSMMRRLYSYDYAIEVDYCALCDLFWFDRDELEALQAIVERQSP